MLHLIKLLPVIILVFATSAQGDATTTRLKEQLSRQLPGVEISRIEPSPVPGVYQVHADMQLFYVTQDGKHVFLGDLVELASRTNLTESWREQRALRLIEDVGEQNMLVIGPKNAAHTMTVFTDVDCPYCAKLHLDVPELNKRGVKVRYLFFPRGGPNSETWRRSVAVWCAADKVKAVGVAKAGGRVDMKTCDNPVAAHHKLGERLGIGGTPTIYLDSGRKLGGYLPLAQMLPLLGVGPAGKAVHGR